MDKTAKEFERYVQELNDILTQFNESTVNIINCLNIINTIK